ncbi:MAG: TIM barrel protein [Anaerolineae bacterium]|nr:TIM barrel protein [Anaerolineae bacterium]
MIIPGLVSITFRQLSPLDILRLAKQAGLEAIEWGGDVHVPHGNRRIASAVGRMTREEGISPLCYGSYYRAGIVNGLEFSAVLESALALGAPAIRIWAGRLGSADASLADREAVTADIIRVVRLAAGEGVRIVLEYHSQTLTDTVDSAIDLLHACGADAPGCLWQPPVGSSLAMNLASIEKIRPWFAHSHVFSWHVDDRGAVERLAFASRADDWRQYFQKMSAMPGDHAALLEFVRDDAAEQLLQDARDLRSLLSILNRR